MNIAKISPALGIAIFAAFFAGCESEDDAIPEIVPTKKVETVKEKEVTAQASDSMPELQPIQSLSANSSTTPETFTTGTNQIVEPGTEGSVTIQVSIQPSKRGANATLKKLGEKGIRAYLAQVENPGELEGTYYRVRVGYFKKIEDAKSFGKNKLEPLGFAWWIDNKANDAVGSPETGESANAYQARQQPTEAPEESIPTDAETPAEPTQAISSSNESASSSSREEAPEIPQPEQPVPETTESAAQTRQTPQQPEQPAEQAPAASEEVYDDWE